MSHTLYMAFAGMRSREHALDVAANNMANLKSTGFKKDQAYFQVQDSLTARTSDELARQLNGPSVRAGVATDFSMGNLSYTGNPLDLALGREGFFAVSTPEGTRYTRNGSFAVSGQNELITAQGLGVLGEDGEVIQLPEGQVQVSSEGAISVNGVAAGKLEIVHFENLDQLQKMGGTLFLATPEAKPVPPTRREVHQGSLEEANVDAVRAMTEMIAVMRSFEMLSRASRAIKDDVDQRIVNEIGNVQL